MNETHELRQSITEASSELLCNVKISPDFARRIVGLLTASLSDSHWTVRLAACNAIYDISIFKPDYFSDENVKGLTLLFVVLTNTN